ncbi:MAG TPA: glycosyl transferase [Xanthobacteraceae bacterium]|jgi:UDP-N-acetylmuramyl pentapeptide phosphotransferase/UDP-N-acetylglucosamine-1-phosphate transferase|nr:glycosyl transferase [Xanthobacteraceae bacterium]
MIEQATERLWILAPAAFVAFFLTTGLMVLLRPWLARYAMAQPNARSSHHNPTPQGGGIAIVVATLAVAWGVIALSPVVLQHQAGQFLAVSAATVLLGVVGAIDDMRSLPATARLAAQCIAVGAVITALPPETQIIPHVPWAIERAGLFLAGVWFVNLVNFMDGIDWMMVAEAVPVTGAILVLGLSGVVAPLPALFAAALLGAIVGFAPFNKPVARIFLGDVGSLPIGLLLGWLLLQLAATGHLAAALILPLYYVADATITLLRRIARGETIWQAHRTHFYQRATDRGLTVPNIVARVFVVNLILVGLAFITVAAGSITGSLTMLTAGAAMVLWLLAALASGKRGR